MPINEFNMHLVNMHLSLWTYVEVYVLLYILFFVINLVQTHKLGTVWLRLRAVISRVEWVAEVGQTEWPWPLTAGAVVIDGYSYAGHDDDTVMDW